ncbi:MAG TPA: sugar phosphate nucleotidyltransferase [Terrimicrobiaceae bacterium]|nr:sugar phosphate nucleotidyltransferase [Terrimicrobiaceae bacterium]
MTRPIDTAFVLGAGLGTRLRPLTDVLPKPLIPIFGKPLITFALDHLAAAGVRSFVINTHHLAAQFPAAFPDGLYRGLPVRLVHEPVLLETGGGIKNAEPWLGAGPFLVYSGDILTDIDVPALIEEHFRRGNDVTLALRDTGLAAGVCLKNGRVVDIRKGPAQAGAHDFANVSVWNPEIFRRIPPATKTSFIPVVVEWIKAGGKIGGLVLNERSWFNVGSRHEYLAVHESIRDSGWKPLHVRDAEWPVGIDPGAAVDTFAHISGVCSIGPGCEVGRGAVVEDSILWPGTRVTADAHLRRCVATGSMVISGRYEDTDL